MNEFFKKIGIPATVAGFAGAVVTATLFIFQVDTRYAKSDTVTASESRVNEKIDALTSEVSKLTGATQVLIQISTKLNVAQDEQRLATLQNRNGNGPDEEEILDPMTEIVGGPRPAPVPTPPVAVAKPPPAPITSIDSPLSSQLRTVSLPDLKPDELRNADVGEVQSLLKQTDEALDVSRDNLKTIQRF